MMKTQLIIIIAVLTALTLNSCLGKKDTQETADTSIETTTDDTETALTGDESGREDSSEMEDPVDETPVAPIVYEELPDSETPPGTFAESVVYLDPVQFPPHIQQYGNEWEAPPLFLETGGDPYLKYDEYSNIFILVDWQAQPGGLTLRLTAPDGSVYEKDLDDEEVAKHSTEFDDWGFTYDPPIVIFFLQPTALYPPGMWSLSVLQNGSVLGSAESPSLSQSSSFLKTDEPDPFFDPFISHALNVGDTARFLFRDTNPEQTIIIYKYESWDEDSYTETSLPVLAAKCYPAEEGLYELTFTVGEGMEVGNYRVGLAGEADTLQHVYFDIVDF